METNIKTYSNPLLPTSQFRMCGNCFRADMYRGCSFGCEYCFVNARGGKFDFKFQMANVDLIRTWFKQAIEEGDVSNIKKEFLNRRVPIHLGGLSDPFQEAEWKYEKTYEFLKLTKEYNYPVNISTKVAHLPEKYFDILDPNIHTFSLSILGYNNEYAKVWEKNTPSPQERINFAKELKKRGFWVSIRIQPIIDIEEVLLLIKHSQEYVDYYTVEHLKLPCDNKKAFLSLRDKLMGCCKTPPKLIAQGREFEFDAETKVANIQRIKSATKVPIGCGDNDLHILSDSLNCCGIDTMPEAFKNWFKYNSMYIKMTGDRTQWHPKANCNQCFNGACVKKGFSTMKQYTDFYYEETYGNGNQLSLF